jgi:predicted NUDIX family NTP pyrophosphohydrolase
MWLITFTIMTRFNNVTRTTITEKGPIQFFSDKKRKSVRVVINYAYKMTDEEIAEYKESE